MVSLQPRPKGQNRLAASNMRRLKRRSKGMFIGTGVILALVLLAGTVFALQNLVPSHAAQASVRNSHHGHITSINGLSKISQVGSTASILGAAGKTITVDPNPYKIAIAPAGISNGLKAGDILVSDIGNNDHGSTIVKFSGQKGPGRIFNKIPNDGTLGPSGLAFNLNSGRLWVANSTGNSVLVFNPNGTLFATIKDPLFNGPWGIATNTVWNESQHAKVSFFVANKFNAKILRIDVLPAQQGVPKFKVVQIGQFTKNGDLTKIDLHWLPQLKIGHRIWRDVLLAIDPANNRIAAFAQSSSISGTGKGVSVFQGKPLNMPGGLAINPLNGDLLVVNLADNNLVELNLTLGKVVGVKQIDPAKVDNQGNGSALFGIAAIKDARGNLKVFFTDDNTNTLDALSAS